MSDTIQFIVGEDIGIGMAVSFDNATGTLIVAQASDPTHHAMAVATQPLKKGQVVTLGVEIAPYTEVRLKRS